MKDVSNTTKYSPLKIQQLKMWLEEMKEKGNTQFFEVYVDDFKVIPKTDAIEDFEKHEQYIDEDTQKITVLTYNTPGSNRYKQHIYLVKDKTMQHGSALSGSEVEARIDEKVKLAKERWDCDKVKENLEEAKGKLKDAEDYIEKLKEIISNTQAKLKEAEKSGDFTKILTELAAQFIPLKNQPKGNLSGAQEEKKPEEQASFSKAESKELSEDEQRYIHAGKVLEEKFTEQELETVFSIIDTLAADKKNIASVASLLNLKINQQKTKNNEKV